VIVRINRDQGRTEQVEYERGHWGKEKSPLAWIQKYLDLADLLIKRGKRTNHKDREDRKAA
jgi:hypothetical protein